MTFDPQDHDPDLLERQLIVVETCQGALEEVDHVQSVETSADDQSFLRVVYDDGAEFTIEVRPVVQANTETLPRPSHGINPVTLRPGAPEPNVTLHRMHIGTGARVQKLLTVLLFREIDNVGHQVLAHSLVNEDHFLNGLAHLFPEGLQPEAVAVCRALVEWWSGFDDNDAADTPAEDAEEIVAMAQKVLEANP